MEPLLSSPPHHFPPDPFVHSGEELLFVLKGRVKLDLNGTHHILNAGDCAYYDGSVPHRSCSVGRPRAMVMLVIAADSLNGPFDER